MYGILGGVSVLRKRLQKCSAAYNENKNSLIDKIGNEMASVDCDLGACNWPMSKGERPFSCYLFENFK
jgi:hypothetical protein